MDFNIAVIGLGYVGLPLAVEFAEQYPTIGFDIDKGCVAALNDGNCNRNPRHIRNAVSMIKQNICN